MTPRVRSAALCSIWGLWAAVVVGHYFVVPPDRVNVFDGPIGVPQFWREAFVRGVFAIAGAAAVTLAAWTVGRRLSGWLLRGLFISPLESLVV